MSAPLTPLVASISFQDPLGARLAAGAAGVLAAVLLWQFVSMGRAGRWRHWTCWSAGAIAAITVVWLIGLLAGGVFDSAWTKLGLLGLLAVATVVVFYHTVYHYLGPVRVGVLLTLRCLAIGVLLLLLFRPAWGVPPGAGDRPMLVVLVDRSQSMNESDAGAGLNRLAGAVEALRAEREKTETYFDVRYFAFDQSAWPVESVSRLAALQPTGSATCIDAALAAVRPLLTGEQADGVILISDGIHNGTGSAIDSADRLPKPLYAVGVGGKVEEGRQGRDVAIERLIAPEQAVSHNVARIEVDVASAGFTGQTADAVLRQVNDAADAPPGAGEELARVPVELADGVAPISLEFTPRQTGVLELELAIEPQPGETLAANNFHRFALRVASPRIKVLYVEGSVRPEYGPLAEELARDPNIELVTLDQRLRPGAGGAVFFVRGTVGGQRFDRMPATPDEFKLFDAFILGDLDRTFLSDEQLRLLAAAVQEQGKGFLMIGGHHSLGPGGYAGTPVEQILPVELGPRTVGQEMMPFKLRLTAQGKVHPIFAGLADLITPPPTAPPSALPELSGCVKLLRAKPSGQVLAVHPARTLSGGADLLPVLAVQAYGAGRTAAFTADTTWRWKMFRTVAACQGVYPRFWRQLVRWLASADQTDADGKGQSVALLNTPRSFFAPGDAVPLTARVWDAQGQPIDDARVEVRVAMSDEWRAMSDERRAMSDEGALSPGSARYGLTTLVLEKSPDQPGTYRGQFKADEAGPLALAMSAGKSGQPLGAGRRKIEVGLPGAEAARRSANLDLLKELAARRPTRTVGYVPLADYPRLIDELTLPHQRRRLAPAPDRSWPAYGRPYSPVYPASMLLFIALLSVEWLLRRRWQLN